MQDSWTFGRDPVNGAGNIYANLIDTFAPALPAVSAAKLADAREVARLLARSIVCADRVIDRDGTPADQARNVLAGQICQYDAICLLHTLVGHPHRLWDEISLRLREFAEASNAEASAAPDHVWTIDAAEAIAMGKNALARITGPLVCAIAEAFDLAAVLDNAVTALIMAVQALDDAMDWRSDLAARRISLITARIWSRCDAGASADEIAAYVHHEAIPQVLRQGQKALSDAIAIRELEVSQHWMSLTNRLSDGYHRIFAVFR